ncbi:putative heme-binding domain-containing protein [Pedobacter sp. CG_S7]|uniref:c-type cytochrome n=1 Tax=Pedobacter sp. CG_S7 TaxID=3143930 RepID=UPI003397AE41
MQVYLKQIAILTALLSILIMGSCNKEPEKKVPLDPKVEKFTVSPDFVIEHLYSPADNKNGSWVSMTFDEKGRMIASDQYGALYRLKLPPIGADSSLLKIEKLTFPKVDISANDTSKTKVEMGYAQGLLWAFNSLYVMVNHKGDENLKKGSGLYRLQDTNGDDEFDKITKLISLEGEGEHGPHSVVLGPDGKSIYIIAGNHTDVPKMDSYRLPSNWKEDNLFQLIKDPQGHANDRMAPGGWIAKTDSVGKHWELIGAGFRNPFDLTFNDEGEMFAYDSDMEWDFGMPWYRPTRLMHVTSGSEFGWRTGNSKWSPSYPDNLPAMINIGQGSPTNLIYAGKANFPEKYRKGLFAFDWSFGIIYAIKLEPNGATYNATAEEFISGAPLPLTDGKIGPDGALYFLTGGRKLDSDLYRVYYKKQDEIKEERKNEKLGNETPEQKIRKQLEQYHKPSDVDAIKFIWPYLKHDDRHIRYAARIALEHQPINSWIKLAWKERNIHAITQSHIALARMGHPNLKSNMLKKLMTINIERISLERKIDLLRAFELVISRMGMPNEQDKNLVINYLDKVYPTSINSLNRELSKILVHLGDPQVVGKTLSILFEAKDDSTYQETVTKSSDLILRNPQYGLDIANMLAKTPPAQQIYLATVLSKAKNGWTPEKSEKYFKWFYDAFGFKGGNSYIGFVDRARKLALENVPKSEFAHYNTISGDSLLSKSGTSLAQSEEGPKGPGRGWTMEDALPIVEKNTGDRDLKQGKMLFSSIRCGTCHSFKGEGGTIGPDLTQLGTRFSAKDMLESILNPNDVISDQYASKVFYYKDGTSTLGRLTNEDENTYFISQNPYAPQTIKKILKKDVSEVRLAKVSLMPPGTINQLNESELKDLIAYLMSGGQKNNSASK